MTNEANYKQELNDLFSNYVEGKGALHHDPENNHPVSGLPAAVKIKPESMGKKIPQTNLALIDEAIRIIAHSKYSLDTYENVIEIIGAEQMREAYASNGMPVSYDHWSFGKNLFEMDRAYEAGKMGLAYEIVINTSPAIAYCMDSNSFAMQTLVIAHASYGHNSFFKGNYMFRDNTEADKIIDDLKELRDLKLGLENRYGREHAEAIVDACHALERQSVNRYTRPPKRTPEEDEAIRIDLERARQYNSNPLMTKITTLKGEFNGAVASNDNKKMDALEEPEENLLKYVATYAPLLEPKEREFINLFCKKAQYFYPQIQTKLMNEGWATFWHNNIIHDLYEEGIINQKMRAEMITSNAGVVFQPEYNHQWFSGINVYALGLAMFKDIRRVCEAPTAEDREWFKDHKDFAGNPDWLSVVKRAMRMFKDETFVMQYLSPKVMRDFGLFVINDDDLKDHIEIGAIHDDEGYKVLRKALAADYRLSDKVPDISVVNYRFRTDRAIVLQHTMVNRKPLERADTEETLKHLHYLWRMPVILNSVDDDGKVQDAFECGLPPAAQKAPSFGGY